MSHQKTTNNEGDNDKPSILRSHTGPVTPIIFALGFLILSIVFVDLYMYLAIKNNLDFTWRDFFLLSLALEIVNVIFIKIAWRYRHRLTITRQAMIMDWAAIGLWYWSLGPIYQIMTLNFNTSQLRLNALAFFWEVPFVGGLAILTGYLILRPIARYVKTGHSANRHQLHRLLILMPDISAFRIIFFTVVGYVIGALQLHYFTHMPTIEAVKDVGTGTILSLFLCMFFYLAYDRLLDPVCIQFKTQYHEKLKKREFHKTIFNMVSLIMLSGLLLFILIFIQSFQADTQNTLINAASNNMSNAINMQSRHLKLTSETRVFRLGVNGKSWVLSPNSQLPVSNVSSQTEDKFISQNSGEISDYNQNTKLIVFRTYQGQKLVSLIYPADFYGNVYHVLLLLLAGAVLLAILVIAVLTVFNGLSTNAITLLIEAVESAKKTHLYKAPFIHSGDEFEDLSEAYETFTKEINYRTNQLIKEQARLIASIEGLSIGYIMTDDKGNIILTNSMLTDLIGPVDSDGWTLSSLSQRLEGKVDLNQDCQSIINKKVPSIACEIDARSKSLRILISPIISNGLTVGTVILLTDFTEEKILDRSKDEFFSIASHELRTPLTAIMGNTSIIKDYYLKDIKNPGLEEMVDDISTASTRLINIVNDFLDISSLEQGKMVFRNEEVDLGELIDNAVNEVGVLAKNKDLYLKVNKETINKLPKVSADPQRVEQIILNLIGNALKFTSHGGISIDGSHSGDSVKILIKDTGKGMSVSDQKLLFRKFQQATSSYLTRDMSGGTGLGLYISKVITEKMGGKLELEYSEQNNGTAFSIELPVATK